MNNITSSLLINYKISWFLPPDDNDYDGAVEDLGFKKFSMMFGDKKTDWTLNCNMVYNGFRLYFKENSSKLKDCNARITCMIPRIQKVEDGNITVDGRMYTEHITRPVSEFTFTRPSLFMKFDDFTDYENEYGEDITVDLFIKIELMTGEFPKEPKKLLNENGQISSNYADIYKSGHFSDFTIVCSDGVKIPVHRCILCGNSPVFKAMMLADMKESVENKLEVKDIDGAVMDKILYFIYTQELKDISEHIEDVIYGAEKYQLNNLKDACVAYMLDNLCVENAVDFFMLSGLYDVERLQSLSLTYIQLNYEALFNTEKWQKLSAEELEMIEKAVKDYKSGVITFEVHMDPEFWGHIM